MDEQLALLLDLTEQRARSTRLVIDARASDERHRVVASRYLHTLDAFRTILEEYVDEDAPYEFPEVQAIAEAFGVRLKVPTS